MRLDELTDVPGVRHRTVRLGDIDLHVAEAGEGPPLLLLHGWPQHWWAWRKLIPPLARHYRVLAPDLRGWGWSDAPAGDYAKATFASDILALLDAEGIDRARIVAHDWGGYASFLLAREHPERVERLVALDIPPPWRTPPHVGALLVPVFLIYQFLIVTPGLGRWLMTSGRLVPLVMRLGAGRGMRWSADEVRAFTEPLSEPARAAASVACYRTFLAREALPALRAAPGLDVPALVIMGGASMIGTITGESGLRTETIPGAGHFLAEEAPDEVLALAEPFLAEGS
jgi:pimeloyl-ACP methyl ester carboxylesterase